MEIIGSLFLVLALAVVVGVFIGQPFLQKTSQDEADSSLAAASEREHRVSSLLAERDRVLNALQELDFDYALGKVPPEDYPQQRAVLMKAGASVLRELDEIEISEGTAAGVPSSRAGLHTSASAAEDRIEAAVAARRADASLQEDASRQEDAVLHEDTARQQGAAPQVVSGTNGNGKGKDELEEIIALRKRERKKSAAGFCPNCGKPVQKSDKFCSKCGATL